MQPGGPYCCMKGWKIAFMEMLQNLIRQITNMHFTDWLDILLLTFLIYKVFPLFRSSGALRIMKAVLVVLVISVVTEWLDMYAIHFLFQQVMAVGLIALVVLFQPELRRILDHLGNVKIGQFFGVERKQDMEGVITQTVMACEQLSKEKVGALIVFSRDNPLDEYMRTGTTIDGQVTEQLLRNIFFPKASLHDGAMIVSNGRVTAAGCVLPLSHSTRIHADLGTRHRAGIGISERTDAVVVIVSEETGTISVAVNGMLKRYLAPQMLDRLLRNELMPESGAKQEKLTVKLRQKLRKNGKGEGKHEK